MDSIMKDCVHPHSDWATRRHFHCKCKDLARTGRRVSQMGWLPVTLPWECRLFAAQPLEGGCSQNGRGPPPALRGGRRQLGRSGAPAPAWSSRAPLRSARRRGLRVLVSASRAAPDLEDLLQDVFASALSGIERLREPSSLKQWLLAITVGRARTYIRWRRRKRWLSVPPFRRAARADDVHDEEHAELVREVCKLLDKLPAERATGVRGASRAGPFAERIGRGVRHVGLYVQTPPLSRRNEILCRRR